MARPETLDDIEVQDVSFGHIDTSKFSTNAALMKAYVTFMDAVQKAHAMVEVNAYGNAEFSRLANIDERLSQLASSQSSWDQHQKYYDQYASIGACESSWQESYAQSHAEKEGLPWPPEHEAIDPIDVVIRNIDRLDAAS